MDAALTASSGLFYLFNELLSPQKLLTAIDV